MIVGDAIKSNIVCCFSLEMLEKIEPPTTIPPGYGISVAYACLLDIVRSISLAIQGPSVVSRLMKRTAILLVGCSSETECLVTRQNIKADVVECLGKFSGVSDYDTGKLYRGRTYDKISLLPTAWFQLIRQLGEVFLN